MPRIAALKQEKLQLLLDVIPAEIVAQLDQSQIYLLSLPEIFTLVLDKVISIEELAKENELCFLRLQKFAVGRMIELIRAQKITLQALSAINQQTFDTILEHSECILADQNNQILVNILVHDIPPIQRYPRGSSITISPWEEPNWSNWQRENPEITKIIDESALNYLPSDELPHFSDIIKELLFEDEQPLVYQPEKDTEISPFSSTHDDASDSDFELCSESMLSTSTPIPAPYGTSRSHELRSLKQLEEKLFPQRSIEQQPRLEGTILHYNRARVQLPENHQVTKEGKTYYRVIPR